ncbi:MAG TPA: hypothetical protein VD996_13220 [Chitinophagaceae bacterium]|nr:hypothetical protein [Chitinophagaceae bacterium]
MNNICTWLCVDEKGEESLFPQTGMLSSSRSHQDIYWRCVLVFFITSRRFNKAERHLLFTNAKVLPVVDGIEVEAVLREFGVDVVFTGFSYKTPKGYYGKFQNQFYEFSILEHIASTETGTNNQYLILDSDCIFMKPAQELFNTALAEGFISFEDNVDEHYVINGLSRNDLKQLYEQLLQRKISDLPSYHLGEFFLASVSNIQKIYDDFKELWPHLLDWHYAGQKKFNEEAHTLSYLFYKNGFRACPHNSYMKRIWTNPLFYRNVSSSDMDLCIWHLPAEKNFGLYHLYKYLLHHAGNYGNELSHENYRSLAGQMMGIPHLGLRRRLKYYTRSYYRAIKKRLSV